jgi:dihydrofolate synthase / folylpolyglutamate synthase
MILGSFEFPRVHVYYNTITLVYMIIRALNRTTNLFVLRSEAQRGRRDFSRRATQPRLPSILEPSMSYAAAIEQLNAMVPELFTSPGQPRRKFSLDQIRILLEALGNPQSRFPSILIAGTNGKGSTAATLASILIESGLKTGLYTSPHLERVNERIRVGRDLITDDDFARHYFALHDAAEKLVCTGALPQLPSFFECLTALAFLYFAEAGVDVAVLEVGMGGRLDATNIVEPLVSIITDISLDHMEWLGSTITAIAHEKARILRRNGTLVTLPSTPRPIRPSEK